jgi:hypothetical protein
MLYIFFAYQLGACTSDSRVNVYLGSVLLSIPQEYIKKIYEQDSTEVKDQPPNSIAPFSVELEVIYPTFEPGRHKSDDPLAKIVVRLWQGSGRLSDDITKMLETRQFRRPPGPFVKTYETFVADGRHETMTRYDDLTSSGYFKADVLIPQKFGPLGEGVSDGVYYRCNRPSAESQDEIDSRILCTAYSLMSFGDDKRSLWVVYKVRRSHLADWEGVHARFRDFIKSLEAPIKH